MTKRDRAINKNNSIKHAKIILITSSIFILVFFVLYIIDDYFYTIFPYNIDNKYLLYVVLLLAVFTNALSLLTLKTNSHLNSSPVNYLKDTNKELNEFANKSESILNAIGDGVVLIDGEKTIKLFNPAASQILGWEIDDVIGLNYNSVIKLATDDIKLSDETNVIQQTIDSNIETRPPVLTMKTKNDKSILVSLVVSPIGLAGQGVIVIFRDVTKEKAEEREQAEFISTASHEMRTPVASIEGYLGLALNPATATIDVRATDYIHKAQSSAKHLGSLFQDLLDISRADDNRLSNNPQVTDIVAFTRSVVDDLQPKASEKNLELLYKPTFITSAGMTKIQPIYYSYIDQNHLRELISNLIENAIKYTPQGRVAVDINGDSDHIEISVMDTGIGIPSEDISHLFQKFYRVDNKETNEIGGTGLGLYLARKLTELLGGRIWVESEYGKGSTFFVEIARLNNPSEIPHNQTEKNTTTIEAPQNISSTPEYTVPRGETLTPEQKAAYVAKLQQINQTGGQEKT